MTGQPILPFVAVSQHIWECLLKKAIVVEAGTTFPTPLARLIYMPEWDKDAIYKVKDEGVLRFRKRAS